MKCISYQISDCREKFETVAGRWARSEGYRDFLELVLDFFSICLGIWSRYPRYPGLSYRGTSLIRNSTHLGPYSRTMPRALWWP